MNNNNYSDGFIQEVVKNFQFGHCTRQSDGEVIFCFNGHRDGGSDKTETLDLNSLSFDQNRLLEYFFEFDGEGNCEFVTPFFLQDKGFTKDQILETVNILIANWFEPETEQTPILVTRRKLNET